MICDALDCKPRLLHTAREGPVVMAVLHPTHTTSSALLCWKFHYYSWLYHTVTPQVQRLMNESNSLLLTQNLVQIRWKERMLQVTFVLSIAVWKSSKQAVIWTVIALKARQCFDTYRLNIQVHITWKYFSLVIMLLYTMMRSNLIQWASTQVYTVVPCYGV